MQGLWDTFQTILYYFFFFLLYLLVIVLNKCLYFFLLFFFFKSISRKLYQLAMSCKRTSRSPIRKVAGSKVVRPVHQLLSGPAQISWCWGLLPGARLSNTFSLGHESHARKTFSNFESNLLFWTWNWIVFFCFVPVIYKFYVSQWEKMWYYLFWKIEYVKFGWYFG